MVCNAIKFCTGTCRLFPAPREGLEAAKIRASSALVRMGVRVGDLPPICNLPALKEICDLINNFANNHYPLDDQDQDGYSPLNTLRGADWRGKDCNDKDARVHAGTRPINNDADADSNCNGIHGTDPATGKTYEELFCAGTNPMGTIVLGDSASAHFHVPPQYLEAQTLSLHTFDNLFFILENEFDWPMLSATTGFANTSSECDCVCVRERERERGK